MNKEDVYGYNIFAIENGRYDANKTLFHGFKIFYDHLILMNRILLVKYLVFSSLIPSKREKSILVLVNECFFLPNCEFYHSKIENYTHFP